MHQYHNQTSPSHFQSTSRASCAASGSPSDVIEVHSTGAEDTLVGESSLGTRHGHKERRYQEQYEDFPESLHYLRQPYYAMNHQPWWDLQTSAMHMSASYDGPNLQGRLSAQDRPSEMPSGSNLEPFTMQSWLDAVLLTPFATFIGRPGSQIVVAFQLHPAATALPALLYFIMFADQSSPATLVTPCNHNSHHDYILTARIPALPGSGEATIIPLTMTAEDNNGKMLFHRDIGSYVFDGRADLPLQSSTPRESRKRRLSDNAPEQGMTPWKRSRFQPSFEGIATSGGANELPLSTPVIRYNTPIQNNHVEQIQPQSLHRGYYTPESHFRSPFRPFQPTSQQDFTPLTRSFSYGAYPAYPSLYPSPAATMSRCSSQRIMVNSSPLMATPSTGQISSMHPKQIRNEPSSALPRPNVSNAPNITARPNLVIEGDLEAMLDDWSEDEVLAKRRLVVFERKQLGHSVSITFEAVTPEARVPGSACVSCIWWEEKQGGYVTSVDTIALAESLCGYKFNVPVKNRIRRNLEGYKPTTVAKDKEDSEEFFKVVMGFPAPKPRNIEKHIKVFPWKSLGRALKKIIGKYVSKPGSMAKESTLTAIQGPTSSSTTRMPAGEQNGGQGFGVAAGRVSEPYLQAHLSPGSATSYSVSMAGSSGQAASRTSASPFVDAARPRSHHPRPAHLEGGRASSDQGPGTFQSADLAAMPHAALHDYHGRHQYARQQGESSDAVYYQWPAHSMQSSYDPGLTATPTTDETIYNQLLGVDGHLPTQAQAGLGMYAMAYYGSGQHAFQRTRSSM